MTSNSKNTVEFCGKNYRKEIIKIVIVNITLIVAAIAVYILYKNLIFPLVIIGLLLAVDSIILSSYRSYKARIIRERDEEFIEMISYFQIFINNHLTVYQCFKLLIPYASSWLAEQLQNLIDDIDNDKSVKPFIDFAKKFNASIVENVMLSIYQMVDQGATTEQLNQFTIFFSQLSKAHQKTLIDRKERSLSIVDSLPLIGTGSITILLILSILFMLGDIIDVF